MNIADDYPLKVGSMLFTLVDPNPGHEVAYNRWYERDHFYGGCMTGPYCFAGGRWVSTRELKDLRFPADETNALTNPWDSGSYLAIYWVEDGHHDDHFNWGAQQVQHLYAGGRGFSERKHAHTALYDHVRNYYRDDDPVPMELALDHGYEGLVSVSIEKNPEINTSEFEDWIETLVSSTVFKSGAAESCSIWKPVPGQDEMTGKAPMDLGTSPGGENRYVQLFFIEKDPREIWDDFIEYGKAVDSSDTAKILFVAPFFATAVGTDRYADQLW